MCVIIIIAVVVVAVVVLDLVVLIVLVLVVVVVVVVVLCSCLVLLVLVVVLVLVLVVGVFPSYHHANLAWHVLRSFYLYAISSYFFILYLQPCLPSPIYRCVSEGKIKDGIRECRSAVEQGNGPILALRAKSIAGQAERVAEVARC